MELTPLSCDALDEMGRGYPRPQLRRKTWFSLNGEWEFAVDPPGAWRVPGDVQWQGRIRVPFSPETEASGVHTPGFTGACWYRRHVTLSQTGG